MQTAKKGLGCVVAGLFLIFASAAKADQALDSLSVGANVAAACQIQRIQRCTNPQQGSVLIVRITTMLM